MELPDKPSIVLKKLSEGFCPYCEIGPRKSIGNHIFMAHGIRFFEIKDALGISRSKGFLENDYRFLKSQIAKEMGLGVSEETRTKPGHTKGMKWTRTATEKLKNHFNKPEVKNRFIENTHNPDAREKARISKKNCSDDVKEAQLQRILSARNKFIEKNGVEAYKQIRSKSSVRATKTRYGTEKGLPDEFYARVAKDFVNVVQASNNRGVFRRLSELTGHEIPNTQRMVKVAVERGLLKWTGEKNYPNGVLTEKAIKILESEVFK